VAARPKETALEKGNSDLEEGGQETRPLINWKEKIVNIYLGGNGEEKKHKNVFTTRTFGDGKKEKRKKVARM